MATPSVPVSTPDTSHGTYTVVSTVTPVTREASRRDALDTACRLLRSSDGTITSTHEPTDYIPRSGKPPGALHELLQVLKWEWLPL